MNVRYPEILEEIKFYLVDGRRESAAFLMWYLENYYRLDKQEAIDSVCDNAGDKGVDGIYVNESLGTIDIFQARMYHSESKTVGDTGLKEFYGTLSQFDSKEKVENLVKEAGKAEVASLIRRLDLVEKIEAYTVRGIFVSISELSSDGQSYLDKVDKIEFIGKTILDSEYISSSKETKVQAEGKFNIEGTEITTYYVNSNTKTFIAPVKAKELVELEGIDDQSIFDYNVRGPLGNTKINRGIVKSVKDKALHRMFPLFHNGITIVASEVEKTEDRIILKNFYVVNGCQSLTSLYRNQSFLTDDLKILTKIIQVPINSSLSAKITEYSNSQNGVKPRDFKSYNPIQVRIQNEIKSRYNEQYFYEVRRGESNSGSGEVISNELSGINLMSFDLKEPWNTHRKYQVFEDAYNKLFARPEVTAEKIIFLHLLSQVIDRKLLDINDKKIARYTLTKYVIMFVVRNILESDDLGISLIQNPSPFVSNPELIRNLRSVLSIILDDIIIDFNAEVDDLGEDFDYKSKLRDESWVRTLNRSIATSYQKQLQRKRIPSFEEEWEKAVSV
jgi:hypothetical protein